MIHIHTYCIEDENIQHKVTVHTIDHIFHEQTILNIGFECEYINYYWEICCGHQLVYVCGRKSPVFNINVIIQMLFGIRSYNILNIPLGFN